MSYQPLNLARPRSKEAKPFGGVSGRASRVGITGGGWREKNGEPTRCRPPTLWKGSRRTHPIAFEYILFFHILEVPITSSCTDARVSPIICCLCIVPNRAEPR